MTQPHRSSFEAISRLAEEGLLRCRIPAEAESLAPAIDHAPSKDRINGMLLGVAVGDSLGSTTEGMLAADRASRYGEIRDYVANRYAAGRRVGTPTDDTQLTFWALESILELDGVDPEEIAHRFTSRRIFGIGNSVRQFSIGYRSGMRWFQAGPESAGNGALMRVSPFALPSARAGGSGLVADIIAGSAITHNDSASIASCLAFGIMLRDLLYAEKPPQPRWWINRFLEVARQVETDAVYSPRGGAFHGFSGKLSAFVEKTVLPALDADLDVRAACDRWYSGAFLLETVPTVLFILARHGQDPEEAVIRAVNDTKDNDTVAAIVGAAVGALHGASAMPRRWVEGLTGRTRESDDGTVQRLAAAAAERYGREN